MTTVIEAIAAWCGDNTVFSENARELAQQAIADTVACLVAGRGDAATRAVRAGARIRPDDAGARVVGGGRAPAPVAALVNGTAAHALDYDDNFRPGMSHASAVIVPALLAVADERGATGHDFVTAYLIALQAQAFVGWGVGHSHYVAGWHGTSTVGSIGTAAGTAWLLGLDAAGIARALTLAVSLASGVKGQFGTMAKPFHAGMAARNAVEAALFARAGLCGRLDILEGEQGFRELYGGRYAADWWNADTILNTAEHVIEAVGVMPKRHPCCGSTHMVLDTILDLQASHGFGAEDVSGVDTLVGIANWRNLAYPEPRDEMQARFSMQYCVARTLRKGVLGLSDFTPEAVAANSPDPLLRAVTMEHYAPERERAMKIIPHETAIRLKSGETVKGSRSFAKGTRAEPFSEEDRLLKFSDCCAAFAGARASEIFHRSERLDSENDLSVLDGLLADGPPPVLSGTAAAV